MLDLKSAWVDVYSLNYKFFEAVMELCVNP